ncbi:hypothetical protein P3T76_000640 [Phytophthora citrophthora]|uniref:Uncharacterized protein n=1 Tax=Phytophthora citrophthora TaxID=4793 RepID=A0AAD9LSI5_9STRA|nr:hypothetical protein P3T76_000640 [Phytophthora citrophthora]
MLKPLSLLLLLPALALAQQQTGNDVLITMPVTIDGSLRNLQLLKGESFEDAAVSFARSHGLLTATDDTQVRAVIDQLSGLLKDKMQEVETAQSNQQIKEAMPSAQLSMPLTIDGYTADLIKYETETPEAAVERFLYASGFSMDVMREVYPQLVALVNRKLQDLQPPKKEEFAFSLSLDGREITVRHFEGGIPMDEAVETLRGIGVQDGEFMDKVAPQIANQIVNEINNRQEVAPSTVAQPQVEEPVHEPPQRRELFSESLTLNNEPAIMVHYEGSTARETAVRFLSENGVTDDATIESLMPQLIGIVDARVTALLDLEAQIQAQSAPAELQKQERKPLVTVPINLDENRQANMEYFEGEDVEATVQRFLVGVGLGEGEGFNNNVVQLSALLRERIAAIQPQEAPVQPQETEQAAQPTRPQPLFSIPVTLSGRVYDLEYFEGQEPYYAANSFCVEKHEIVRAELGVDFDGDQLLACQNVLVQTILNTLEGRQKPQQQPGEPIAEASQPEAEAPAQAEPEIPVQAEAETGAPVQTEAEAPVDPRGVLLFTLDIDMGDGTSIKLPVHRNENPRELASAFCTRHNLDQDNVPALVEAMESQLTEL